MKRVWLMNHYASTPQHGGSTRHYDFAVELTGRGYDVTIIASSFNHDKRAYIQENSFCIENINANARLVWLKTQPAYCNNGINRFLNMISYVMLVKKYYKQILLQFGSPNVVIGSSVHPFAWFAAHHIASKSGAKFIAEVRDLWPKGLIEVAGIKKVNPIIPFFGLLEKWAYKNSEYIITTMPYADRYICDELGFERRKIVWIGNGIFCDKYDENKEFYHDMLPRVINDFIGDNFCCMYTGSFTKSQGVYQILSAAKIIQDKGIKNLRFVLIGDGIEKAKILEKIQQEGLVNIALFDKVPKPHLPALLAKSHICISSLLNRSIYQYGISLNKMNDYCCSGKPIILATNIPQNVNNFSHCGIFIEPEDPVALVEEIIRIYNMPPDEYASFGIKSKKHVKEHHDIPKLVTKLESLF